jgi:hypothetical protein
MLHLPCGSDLYWTRLVISIGAGKELPTPLISDRGDKCLHLLNICSCCASLKYHLKGFLPFALGCGWLCFHRVSFAVFRWSLFSPSFKKMWKSEWGNQYERGLYLATCNINPICGGGLASRLAHPEGTSPLPLSAYLLFHRTYGERKLTG